MKKQIEIVRDFNNLYYAHYEDDGGRLNARLNDAYTDFRTLKRMVREETGCTLPNLSELEFVRYGRKKYANCYLESV